MTVKVMSAGAVTVPREVPVPTERAEEQPVQETGQDEAAPYAYTESVYRRAASRRRTVGFGDIVFVQLVLSALLAVGLWAGSAFGSPEISGICARVAELFR